MSFGLYPNEIIFVQQNPWWHESNRQLFFKHFRSSEARRDMDNITRDKIEQLFPTLWRNQLLSDNTWHFFKNKLDDHTNLKISILDSNTNLGLGKINNAVETKVGELIENKDFGQLKTSIIHATNTKYAFFEQELNSRFNQAEVARNEGVKMAGALIEQQNKTIEKLNKDVEKINDRQVLTFFGGLILGASSALAAKLIR